MHQDDHDVDRLDHPDYGGVLGGGVPPVEGPGECILSEDAVCPEYRGPALDTEQNVNHLKRNHTQDVDLKVPEFDVILGALLAVCFINSTRIEKHDPWFYNENVKPIDGITNIVAGQPVQSILL